GHPVQQPVDVPLDEVTDNEHRKELEGHRPGGDLDGDQVLDPEDVVQEVLEELDEDVRYGVVADEGKQEEVEEHVEHVQPEVPREGALRLAPRAGVFPKKEEQGDPDQPVEVVVPRRMGDLVPQVAGVARIAVDERIDVFAEIHAISI